MVDLLTGPLAHYGAAGALITVLIWFHYYQTTRIIPRLTKDLQRSRAELEAARTAHLQEMERLRNSFREDLQKVWEGVGKVREEAQHIDSALQGEVRRVYAYAQERTHGLANQVNTLGLKISNLDATLKNGLSDRVKRIEEASTKTVERLDRMALSQERVRTLVETWHRTWSANGPVVGPGSAGTEAEG